MTSGFSQLDHIWKKNSDRETRPYRRRSFLGGAGQASRGEIGLEQWHAESVKRTTRHRIACD